MSASSPAPAADLPTSAPPPARDPRVAFALGVGLCIVLAAIGFGLAKLPVLKIIGTLCVTLLVGMTWRGLAGVPTGSAAGIKFAARTLLRLGIVLMGARLNYALVATAGPAVLAIDCAVVIVAIPGLYWLGRRLGLTPALAMMMGVGTGICGASAVVAAGTVCKAPDEETTLGVALMGLLGTIGVFIYVLIGAYLGLTERALGILTGATLHEVAQVVAASSTWGLVSGDMAMLVKLTRVVLLAPVLLLVGAWYGRTHGDGAGHVRYTWKEPPLPYFVLGFLLVGAINTLGWLPTTVQDGLVQTSVFLMAIAMGAMGLNTDLGMLRKAGTTPLLAGFAVFAFIGVMVFCLLHGLGLAAS